MLLNKLWLSGPASCQKFATVLTSKLFYSHRYFSSRETLSKWTPEKVRQWLALHLPTVSSETLEKIEQQRIGGRELLDASSNRLDTLGVDAALKAEIFRILEDSWGDDSMQDLPVNISDACQSLGVDPEEFSFEQRRELLKKKEHFDLQFQPPPQPLQSIICSRLVSNWVAFQEATNLNQQWGMLSVNGMSGSGKSRLSFELPCHAVEWLKLHPNVPTDLIAALDPSHGHVVDVFVKQTNGFRFPMGASIKTMDEYLAFATLYSAVANKPLDLVKLVVSATFPSVARGLREHFQLGPADTLTIWLRIDEAQELLDARDAAEGHRSTTFYHLSRLIMAFTKGLASFKVFVIPVWSGTYPLSKLELVKLTDYRIEGVPLSSLPTQAALELVRAELTGHDVALLHPKELPTLVMLLGFLGPIPRPLSFLVHHLRRHPLSSMATAYQATITAVLGQFRASPPLTLDQWHRFLFLVLSGVTLAPNDPAYSYAWKLVAVGLCSMTDTGSIECPLYILRILVDAYLVSTLGTTSRNTVPLVYYHHFKKFMTPDDRVPPNYLEQFVVWFYALKQVIFILNGSQDTHFQVFFKGAMLSPDLEYKPLRLGSPIEQVYETCNIHTASKPLNFAAVPVAGLPPKTLNLVRRGTSSALLIGKRQAGRDAVLIFPEYAIDCQMKVKEVQQVAAKGESPNTLAKALKTCATPHVPERHQVLLFVTTGAISKEKAEEVLKNHSGYPAMLIAGFCWESAFTKTFSWLAEAKPQKAPKQKKVSTSKQLPQ